MPARLYINCLGTPKVLDDAGTAVAVPTRKALAILVYLLRTPGRLVPREQVADILWSKAPRDKAIQSLRQALRQVRRIEEASGVRFLEADKGHVGLAGSVLVSDFGEVSELLESGGAADFEAALARIRGPLLNGYETLDPVFQDWLTIERQRLLSDYTSSALKVVDTLSLLEEPERVEAGCRFLLGLDSALEHAHQLLIKLYLVSGRKAEAHEQLKRCEAELKAHLDAVPDEETLRLFNTHADAYVERSSAKTRFAVEPVSAMATATLCHSDRPDLIQLPQLTIASFVDAERLDSRAYTILDDIRSCLGAYRNVQIYENDNETQGTPQKVTYLDAGELGSYLLRFRHDAHLRLIYLQLENRVSGQVLFNEVIEIEQVTDFNRLREATSQTVNRIQSHVIGRLRARVGKQPFSRWCQAEALLCEFSPSADRKAVAILDELQAACPTYSVSYSGKASVGLKQLLHYPDFRTAQTGSKDVLDLAEQGVLLDPWHVFNRRMHGWSLLQSGFYEEARRAFAEAARLNPFDPTNLMSIAEGMAYIGDVEEARRNAERAFSLFPVIPRFFYEYLANIKFSAGDYTSALELLDRAPTDGILSITTRIAAFLCSGRDGEARDTLDLLSRRHAGRFADVTRDRPEEILGWLNRINLYQDPQTRMHYKRGADMVRSYLLAS